MPDINGTQETSLDAIKLPQFTSEERLLILQELHVMQFQNVGNIIAINSDWVVEIISDSRYSFHSEKSNEVDICNFLLKVGEVGIYSGSHDDVWYVGFRLIPAHSTTENPYNKILRTFQEAQDIKRTDIESRIREIQAQVDALLKEKRELETKKESLQDYVFTIPGRVINGEELDSILEGMNGI